jgi:hypothetical protein
MGQLSTLICGALVAAGVLLAGCGGPPVVTQSTPAFVEVGAQWTTNSGELVSVAQSHCQLFGRHARQGAVRETIINGLGGRVVSYDCVP